LCPCPKSKLLVFYSNFFSAIHIRTVELKPREDIHTGTEGKALHAWLKLVTCVVTCDRMPEPLVKGRSHKRVAKESQRGIACVVHVISKQRTGIVPNN